MATVQCNDMCSMMTGLEYAMLNYARNYVKDNIDIIDSDEVCYGSAGLSRVLGFMKRSRLGCHTGSNVWVESRDFRGSGWQGSGCQGSQGFQGSSGVQSEMLVDC